MYHKIKVTNELDSFLQPGKKFQFGLDTSGSEPTQLLRAKVDTIKTLVEVRNLKGSTIFAFDHLAYEVVPVEDFGNSHLQGGGGSDARPAFEQYDKEAYDGLVLFTDGYTYFPIEHPNFPVLICLDDVDCQQNFLRLKEEHANFNLTVVGEKVS